MEQVPTSGAEMELMKSTTYIPNKDNINSFEDLRDFVFEVLDQCSFIMLEGVTFEDLNRNPKFWMEADSADTTDI